MLRYRYIIILLCCLYPVSVNGQHLHAKKGILDLRELQGDKFSIYLNGEWAFYWNRMVYPREFRNGKGPGPTIYGNVPSYWTAYKTIGDINRYGFATYQLYILLPELKDKRLALDIPVFDSSFDMWINDSLIYSNGHPDRNPDLTIPAYKPGFLRYVAESDTLNILINVANFHHRRGGFWMPMKIGTFITVQKSKAAKYARDYSSVSILAGFAVFFIIFFILSPKDRILAFFSFALIGMSIRPFFTSSYLIGDYTEMAWVWIVRLEYISLYIIITGWIWFADRLYPSRFIRVTALLTSAFYIAALIITLILPVRIFSHIVMVYYVSMALLISYILYWSFRGLLGGKTVEIVYFFALLVLSTGVVNDILVSLGKPPAGTGYIMPYVVVIFIFFQAVLLLYKWIFANYENEKLRLQLEYMNRHLEEMIGKRTVELQHRTEEVEKQNERIALQNRQLSETLSIKNRIFSVIAHDLRSPVVNILYMLNLLKEKEYKEKYDTFANSSIQYAQMVINLLENMLVWGRGQEEKIRFAPSSHDMASVILTNLSIFKESADRKDIDVHFTQKGNSSGYFDKDLMDIVIRNLLSNAIKYTGKGGRISILLRERSEAEGDLMVKICDNGIGIPPERQKKLFSPEEIISTPGTDNEKGTGLGLKLCQELVLLNNGSITVESREGEGTCFIITIPAGRDKSPFSQR